MQVGNFTAEFNGTTDFSKAFSYLLNNFESFFKIEVSNTLANLITSSFQDSLNTVISNSSGILPYDTIFLNYTLIGDPIFNQDYMTLAFDGTFLESENPQSN